MVAIRRIRAVVVSATIFTFTAFGAASAHAGHGRIDCSLVPASQASGLLNYVHHTSPGYQNHTYLFQDESFVYSKHDDSEADCYHRGPGEGPGIDWQNKNDFRSTCKSKKSKMTLPCRWLNPKAFKRQIRELELLQNGKCTPRRGISRCVFENSYTGKRSVTYFPVTKRGGKRMTRRVTSWQSRGVQQCGGTLYPGTPGGGSRVFSRNVPCDDAMAMAVNVTTEMASTGQPRTVRWKKYTCKSLEGTYSYQQDDDLYESRVPNAVVCAKRSLGKRCGKRQPVVIWGDTAHEKKRVKLNGEYRAFYKSEFSRQLPRGCW